MKTATYKFISTALGMQDVAMRRIKEETSVEVTIRHNGEDCLAGTLRITAESDEQFQKTKRFIANHPVFSLFFKS